MKRLFSLLLALAVTAAAQPARAEELPCIELRDLTRGAAISIELKNGKHVSGTVGDIQWDGFWVDHALGDPSFVPFRKARAVLDPSSGTVIGVAAHDRDGLPKWVWPTVSVTGIVAALVIGTGGRFPLCFFLDCRH